MRLSYASLNKQNFRFFAFIFIHVAENIYQERWILRRLCFLRLWWLFLGIEYCRKMHLHDTCVIGDTWDFEKWKKTDLNWEPWKAIGKFWRKTMWLWVQNYLKRIFLTGNSYISRKHLINNVKSGRYLKDYWISYVLCCGW